MKRNKSGGDRCNVWSELSAAAYRRGGRAVVRRRDNCQLFPADVFAGMDRSRLAGTRRRLCRNEINYVSEVLHMKIVIVRSPKIFCGILRLLFKIK